MVLVACGGSSATTPDAPVVDARPDTPAARHIGMVAIIEGNLVNGTSTAVFGAFGVDNLSTVLSRDDGPCHIEQTTTQGSTVLDDAGTVTVSGGSSGDIVITPNSSKQYFSMSQGLTFAAGATVTMSGTGSIVPPFSRTLTFPARVTVTSTLAALSKASGFSVTWTATTGSVAIRVIQHPGGTSDEVNCVFDGNAGTGTVPTSALAELVAGTTATVTILTDAQSTGAAADYAVTFDALFAGAQATVAVQP